MKIKLLILILGLSNYIFGQQYPVQTNLQLIPPYTVYLSDFTSSMLGNRMQVTALLKDIQQGELQVKFKFTIEGLNNNVLIQTSENFMPSPVFLNAGVPEIIPGADLAEYFDPQNLIFSGLNENDFRYSSKLPEGLYKFTFQVVEYNRSVVVSNASTSTAWLMLNEPPQWISPMQNTILNPIKPQNIVFTWMPLHTGSPNSAFSTEYEFTIAEVPTGISPQEAIEQNNPGFFYQTTISNTSFLYNNNYPSLRAGNKYACRIRAYDISGLDVFRNNGYSEILTFTYGYQCETPLAFQILETHRYETHLSWQPRVGNIEWNIEYRAYLSDTSYGSWRDTIVEQSDYWLQDLNPSTKYQIRIRAVCALAHADVTQIQETETSILETLPCDDNTEIPEITNTNLITSLSAGDIITMGNFNIELKHVTKNTDGTFSGDCHVTNTPFLVKLKGSFSNLKVNTSNQVLDGEIDIEESNEINDNSK